MSRTQVWSQTPRLNWQTHSFPAYAAAGMVPTGYRAVPCARQRMSRSSFFTNESMIRRVQRESAIALSGPRTLLMQAAHPVAFTGFFAHTGALDDPYARLQRTVRVLGLIGWGDKREAQKATARVREIHSRIHGVLPEAAGRFPAGTPYSATDPDLLLWILACMADSALVVYERYVGSLSRDERDAFWQDYKVIGREFGLRDADMPEEIEDFELYMTEMVEGDDLFATPQARELALSGGAEYTKRLVVPLLPDRLRYRRRPRRAA